MTLSLTPRLLAAALTAAAALSLPGCAQPPTGIPSAENIRGLKPSGTVTMRQFFVSGTGAGSGVLAFGGRTYPFTMIGTLIGPVAISALEASGTVYNLSDPSQFSGSYLQGTGPLAVTASLTPLPGEIWLKNNHGVIMRLQGQQTGLMLSRGRYEFLITLGP